MYETRDGNHREIERQLAERANKRVIQEPLLQAELPSDAAAATRASMVGNMQVRAQFFHCSSLLSRASDGRSCGGGDSVRIKWKSWAQFRPGCRRGRPAITRARRNHLPLIFLVFVTHTWAVYVVRRYSCMHAE